MAEQPLSVADFITRLNQSLLPHSERVLGEVTSLRTNYATAIYFTIKDKSADALLDCMIWRNDYEANSVDLNIGDEIVISGTPEIYAPRGRFSLKVVTIEYAGEGNLKREYEKLKKKLAKEGLFDPARKQPLPALPKKVGLITSKAGVVIQDFSSNLGAHGFQIKLIDSRVEGKEAIHELLSAIRMMASQDIEVLAIMRGGGSWESLQPFNTESLVREIAGFKCPVVTGIGHDVDVTLCEMVADVGVSTPTAVAQVLNRPWDDFITRFESVSQDVFLTFKNWLIYGQTLLGDDEGGIFRSYERQVQAAKNYTHYSSNRIFSSFRNLERKILAVNSSLQSSAVILRKSIVDGRRELSKTATSILEIYQRQLAGAHGGLGTDANYIFEKQSSAIIDSLKKFKLLEQTIKLSDPRRHMKLGYSLTYAGDKLLRKATDVKAKSIVTTHLADGGFTSEVKDIK